MARRGYRLDSHKSPGNRGVEGIPFGGFGPTGAGRKAAAVIWGVFRSRGGESKLEEKERENDRERETTHPEKRFLASGLFGDFTQKKLIIKT